MEFNIIKEYSGLIAFIVSVVGFPLVKFFVSRMVQTFEESILILRGDSKKLQEKISSMEIEQARTQEQLKEVPMLRAKIAQLEQIRIEMMDKYLPKGDFIREIQIVSNQIEANYKKTDLLASTVEKLREPRK